MKISAQTLQRINRPSRYLGGERGSIRKEGAQVNFALAFPDVYEVGMSHIGSAILYHLLNGLDGVAAERVYAPWPDLEEQLRRTGEPLCSLESTRPLDRFDIVGFSLQYELSYTNVLNMLRLSGIPLRREDRDEEAPLIVVGGPCAFNPEPLADFIDCAVIGDGEEAVAELCCTLRDSRAAEESRATLLERLAAIEGIYVPSLFAPEYRSDGRLTAIRPLKKGYEKVRRRFLADLEDAPYPEQPIVPFLNTVHDRVAVEIARGCTRGCRFCQAGYIYRPVRERSPQRITQIIENALAHSGYDEVSLLSLSTGDYGCIEPLLKGLMARYAEERVAVSFPSLRVGSLTTELMEEIKKVRKTGFTLAPEAGTERLRRAINKGISEEELLSASRSAFELGWRVLKLYFMIGLPTETDEDLEGIVELAARVKRSGKGTEGGAAVNVSASTFVPKAHTPFQWEAQIGIEETRRRQDLLRQGLKSRKLRLKWHEAEVSFLEGVFARGDRRLGRVLEEAVERGCRFDGWSDHFSWERWQQAFAACGIDPAFYLRERTEEEVLPWDHIDCGIPKEFFIAERRKARTQGSTPDCRTASCSACGICDFDELRPRLCEPAAFSPPAAPEPAPPLPDEEQRYKLRLRVRKGGRARFISHLEFMTAIHRALRRAGLPLRYSQGFHPAPRVSFPEALPLGMASEAEIIDLELYEPLTAREGVERLNAELPEGIRALEGALLPWRTPSSSASIGESVYEALLPPQLPADLPLRIAAFLAAEQVEGVRMRKGREVTVDLRKDVRDLHLEGGRLRLTLSKGSPLALLAHLLDLDAEQVRELEVIKIGVVLK